MTAGLIQYVLGRHRLKAGIARLGQQPSAPTADTAAAHRTAEARGALSADEWKRIIAIVIFFLAASIFWGGYEQAGSTLNLFADRNTRLSIFGYEFPSSWFQSLNSLYIMALAPLFVHGIDRIRPASTVARRENGKGGGVAYDADMAASVALMNWESSLPWLQLSPSPARLLDNL